MQKHTRQNGAEVHQPVNVVKAPAPPPLPLGVQFGALEKLGEAESQRFPHGGFTGQSPEPMQYCSVVLGLVNLAVQFDGVVLRALGDGVVDALVSAMPHAACPNELVGQWRALFELQRDGNWWMSSILPVVALPRAAEPRLPPGIVGGCNCDDVTRGYEKLPVGNPFPAGQRFLYFGCEPAVGQYATVEVQLNKLTASSIPGEKTDWFMLGGRVTAVLDEGSVELLMTPTTLHTPLKYEGEWRVVLGLDLNAVSPWVLRSMSRVEQGEKGGAA